MEEKIARMRYLNLKQHIDALHLAKLIDDNEAMIIRDRLDKQISPFAHAKGCLHNEDNEASNGTV